MLMVVPVLTLIRKCEYHLQGRLLPRFSFYRFELHSNSGEWLTVLKNRPLLKGRAHTKEGATLTGVLHECSVDFAKDFPNYERIPQASNP